MYYEINVSLDGQHFFATAKRSITDTDKLKVVYGEIVRKFPKKEGFSVSVTKYEETGHMLDIKDLAD